MLVALQCLTLCDPMDCSPPGSSVHGILQARILEWVALLFSRGSSQPGIEPRWPELQADPLLPEPGGSPYNPLGRCISIVPPWKSKVSLSPMLPEDCWGSLAINSDGYTSIGNSKLRKVKVTQCLILRPHGLYSPWNSPGQNTRLGNLSLLQGIFPTQGLNPGLLHCRQILYQLSHKGSPN